jgi:two-component system response regulator
LNNAILLVEDNEDDIELTRIALEQHHLVNRIDVARDGVEALAMLDDPSQSLPAVVLLDLKLPKIDGIEVLRRIRSNPRTRALPVVILTSSREEKDVVASYNLGANSYVRKPVDFQEFVVAAKQLGIYWLLLNERIPQP